MCDDKFDQDGVEREVLTKQKDPAVEEVMICL